MKVLSIQQPWAELIVSGLKDIENRDWPTKFRGEFLIHASKRFDKESLKFISENFGIYEGKTEMDFLLGGIVGKSEIIDCVIKSDSPWFFGKFGFVLHNSQRINFIPIKGKLGFWNFIAKHE